MPGRRLTVEERLRIEALYAAGMTFPRIAELLGRDRTTVWREVRRNNSGRWGPKSGRPRPAPMRRHPGYQWGYQGLRAHTVARLRGRRPKACKLGRDARGRPTVLREVVRSKLGQRWSPQQIAGWLRDNVLAYPELQVSHETIYQALYVQSRGNLRAELRRQVALRSGRAARSRRREVAGPVRSRRPWTHGFNISTRPAEVEDRAVPGNWEGDLMIGVRGASAIITLVERSTRYVMLGALPRDRTSAEVVPVLTGLIGRLPEHVRGSLTWDCGGELADHTDFTVASGCKVFFADPHSPWQRGSNENTNGLLRQYFPKGVTDFHQLTQTQLDGIAHELNGRPRQTLEWKTPRQALREVLVAPAA